MQMSPYAMVLSQGSLRTHLVHEKRRGESVVNGKMEKGLIFGWSFQKREMEK